MTELMTKLEVAVGENELEKKSFGELERSVEELYEIGEIERRMISDTIRSAESLIEILMRERREMIGECTGITAAHVFMVPNFVRIFFQAKLYEKRGELSVRAVMQQSGLTSDAMIESGATIYLRFCYDVSVQEIVDSSSSIMEKTATMSHPEVQYDSYNFTPRLVVDQSLFNCREVLVIFAACRQLQLEVAVGRWETTQKRLDASGHGTSTDLFAPSWTWL